MFYYKQAQKLVLIDALIVHFCISDTFIAKENKDIRLVQQQTKHLCKCKYASNNYAS